jgi:osmotically-inducible protein OsmY
MNRPDGRNPQYDADRPTERPRNDARDTDFVPRSYEYDLDHTGRRRFSNDDRDFFDKAADEVQSWFGDEAAHQRRELDHRGKGPRGYQRSDERIADDVHQRLFDDHLLDASDIEVTVSAREITLNGTVDSREAKRHAENCADAVSGVEHVQNNLRVRRIADPATNPTL